MATPEDQIGSVETFTSVPDKVIDTDDGGAIVQVTDDVKTRPNREWYANIADDFEDGVLNKIATRLLLDIERDKKAREKREKDCVSLWINSSAHSPLSILSKTKNERVLVRSQSAG